jgi:hypothetical protein
MEKTTDKINDKTVPPAGDTPPVDKDAPPPTVYVSDAVKRQYKAEQPSDVVKIKFTRSTAPNEWDEQYNEGDEKICTRDEAIHWVELNAAEIIEDPYEVLTTDLEPKDKDADKGRDKGRKR